MKHIHLLQLICLATAACLLLCSCSQEPTAEATKAAVSATSSALSAAADTTIDANSTETAATAAVLANAYSDRDLDPSYDATKATTIAFSDDGTQITGEGASMLGNVLTISQEGIYILSGTLRDGRIAVSAGDTDKVQLVLNNCKVTGTDYAALTITQADKVFLTLAEGSSNYLEDGESYTLLSEDDNTDATVFSKADLTVNGTGSLVIIGNYGGGIVSKDDLVITGGSLTVTAAKSALAGKDCVCINGGTLLLNAGTDGIKSTNAEDADKGYIYISGGDITIAAESDGIRAETKLIITDGTTRIVSGGGSVNAVASTGGQFWGNTASEADTVSAKGLKADGALRVEGGNISVDSADDAVHAGGSILIGGGTMQLTAGDDGIHTDEELVINGGTIRIEKSYEGLEGLCVTINGGNTSVIASDDGINAAGGSDTGEQQRPGMNSFNFNASSEYKININGGYTFVDAAGDGVDSNGTISVTGGVLLVSGPTDNGNGALDYEQSATITGGIVLAAGSSGMAANFSNDSTQCANSCTFSAAVNGSYNVAVVDSQGNVLVSLTPGKNYSSIVFSTPAMQVGDDYTVLINGTPSNADENGYASTGTLSGGSTAGELTQTSTVSGITGSGMGGRGGMGGRP